MLLEFAWFVLLGKRSGVGSREWEMWSYVLSPHSPLPICLLLGHFYMYGPVGADGAHLSPASAYHPDDRPTAQLRPGFEFQREFGVDRPVVALDRQVEIAFGRQGQNDVAVGAEEQVAPAF